jgi:serine/threonine-protein kinase RsbW
MDKRPIALIIRTLLERALPTSLFEEDRTTVSNPIPQPQDIDHELWVLREQFFADLVKLLTLVAVKLYPSEIIQGSDQSLTPEHRSPVLNVSELLQEVLPLQSISVKSSNRCKQKPGKLHQLNRIRTSALGLHKITTCLEDRPRKILPGYQTKVLKGYFSQEHDESGFAQQSLDLPGMSELVIIDPEKLLILDYFSRDTLVNKVNTGPDLLDRVITTINNQEIWIFDTKVYVQRLLYAIDRRNAYFIVCSHGSLQWEELGPLQPVANLSRDKFFQQRVQIKLQGKGEVMGRRIVMQLHQAQGEDVKEYVVFTNLPDSILYAQQIMQLSQYQCCCDQLFTLRQDIINYAQRQGLGSWAEVNAPVLFEMIGLSYNLLITLLIVLRSGLFLVDYQFASISCLELARKAQEQYFVNWASGTTSRDALAGIPLPNDLPENSAKLSNILKAWGKQGIEHYFVHEDIVNPPYWMYLKVNSNLWELNSVLQWLSKIEGTYHNQAIWLQCKIAVAEGFTNVVRHSHGILPPETQIELEVSLIQNGIEIRIWDFGEPFNLWGYIAKYRLDLLGVLRAWERIPRNLVDRLAKNFLPEHGRGIPLMQEIADYLSYIQHGERCNCLILIKYFYKE